jgi:hypothetical protein
VWDRSGSPTDGHAVAAQSCRAFWADAPSERDGVAGCLPPPIARQTETGAWAPMWMHQTLDGDAHTVPGVREKSPGGR